jgi:hypothetical protein
MLLSALAISRTGNAQTPQEMALARTLFQEGVSFADRGDWVGAADRFDRAYSIKPTSGIAFNWARALAETGQLLHARELLLTVERDEGADAQLRRESSALLKELEPRVARVRITTDRKPSETLTITLDDQNWPRAAWGIASPIDPGSHTAVCKEAGEERARETFTLGEGEQRDVVLRLRGAGDAAPSGALEQSEREGAHRPLYKSWLLWSAVGVVVVGGAVTGVLLATKGDSESAQPVVGNATPGVIRW